jgi:hypothetical protein
MRAGHEELGIVLFQMSTDIARECHDLSGLVRGLSNLASARAQRDAVAAGRVADEAMENAQRAGLAAAQSNAVINLVIGRWALGDWDVVETSFDSELLQTQDLSVTASVAALVLAARGRDPGPVVDAVPELEETRFYLDLGRAVAQAYAGDPEAVSTASAALDGAYAISGIYEDFTVFYGAALEVATQFADADLLDRLRAIVDDDGSSPPMGLAGHRALLTALDAERVGDADETAESAFGEAVRCYQTWGSKVHLARARAAYGLWLQARGRLADAEPLLVQAREQYVALGATAWLEELEHRRQQVRA